VLRAIMKISARAISLADRTSIGHWGHQCSHAPASLRIKQHVGKEIAARKRRSATHIWCTPSGSPRKVAGLLATSWRRHALCAMSAGVILDAIDTTWRTGPKPACAWGGRPDSERFGVRKELQPGRAGSACI